MKINLFEAIWWSILAPLKFINTPISREIDYQQNQIAPNAYLQPQDYARLRLSNVIDNSGYYYILSLYGYTEQEAKNLLYLTENKLAVGDYVTLLRRGEISEEEFNNLCFEIGYTPYYAELIKSVSKYFPNVSDLVRFAVREVYSSEIRETYMLDEDLPDKFIEEAYKAGLPADQAKNYWAAHWELPSATMGFEMYHRGVITKEELVTLLRSLDYMPYWRDKLIDISHTPLTRVDVRRMYGMGVITEDEVLQCYKDIGYNDTNARRLTNFTVLYENDENEGLTRSQIISSYISDMITENECTQYLQSLGYSEKVIDFYMSQANYQKTTDETMSEIKNLQVLYTAGVNTIEDVEIELNKLNLPANYIKAILKKYFYKLAEKVKMPEKSDLFDWIELGIIKDEEFASYMSRLGYQTQEIIFYLTQFALEKDVKKKKYLPIATYLSWVSSQIITEQEFKNIGLEMGYSEEDLERLLQTLSVE
jgi:hypothetical protein